jgi:iron complex outermembrane receptor protein
VDATPAPPHLTLHIPYTNGLQGKANGFEVTPDFRPAPWVDLKAAYSYLSIALKPIPGLTDVGNVVATDEGSSPKHLATLGAVLELPGRVEVDPTFRYVSRLPAQGVKGYATADLRLAFSPRRSFEVAIVGADLLQPRHAEFGGDTGGLVFVRRSLYAQVTYRR